MLGREVEGTQLTEMSLLHSTCKSTGWTWLADEERKVGVVAVDWGG